MKDLFVNSLFRDHIIASDFPCIGAKTALHQERIHLETYGNIECDSNNLDIIYDIQQFVDQYRNDQKPYLSFVAVFKHSFTDSDKNFESALWRKLQALHELDSLSNTWDERVSSDPSNKNFGYSISGQAFFIIGLSPSASRRSRRFDYPALVFNLHDQFEKLRHTGTFETLRNTIRNREKIYSGSTNPMLADHGVKSEARQYSGRCIPDQWQCPFQVRTNDN